MRRFASEVPIQDVMTATGLADDPPLEIPADPMIDRWIVALRRRTNVAGRRLSAAPG